MSKPKVLIQLDPDPHASVFDALVAIDSEIDHLLQYERVEPTDVEELVHGAMFTRGPRDLHQTAIFVGGRDVAVGELLLSSVRSCFFGPMRVSIMLDANGANTTAAAAIVAAGRHVDLSAATVAVLAATGPVGQRAALLAASAGARVRVGSRSGDRASAACGAIQTRCPTAQLEPVATADATQVANALADADVVIAAGTVGVELISEEVRRHCPTLKVAIDLNAVPPVGIAGVEVTASAVEQDGVICYGAIGVGGTKMKIHKAAIQKLFTANDLVLDAEQIYDLARDLEE
ncbi:MAG: methylene-tetrahydromethanopterin dehydrogenase N-terminal domain-containing protein [Pirellulaceae bacterium]|jgi:hypothetical protein|nr:methylene-tetrahydromethanopterin dehydrogenase N-terminal domain-containing protein [Pirellulaceae bacterium]